MFQNILSISMAFFYIYISMLLMAWALGVLGSRKDPKSIVAKNEGLNFIIVLSLFIGIPILSFIILYNLGLSDYKDNNPLGYMFWGLVLSSVGYACFFFRGSFTKIFFKFVLSIVLFNILVLSYFILFLDNKRYMEMMNKSCDYGNAIACKYAEQRVADMKEQERFDAIMEYGEFDLEQAQELERQYEQEKKKWEGK